MSGEESADSVGSVEFNQRHEEVVLDRTWWWAVHISLCSIALIANLVFLAAVVFSRNRHQLKSFVSVVIITIAVLDIVDVLRVIPVLVKALFLEEIFRHIFCSFGVFHELAVAVFIVSLSIAVCVQAGKETKFYQNSTVAQRVVVPLVLLLTAGAAAPFFLLPYDKLSHTCTDPMRVAHVLDTESEKFTADLYATVVTVFTYVLPVLVIPLAIPIASVRTCVSRQCCVPRFKQPIGELIMVTMIAIVYLGTIICIILPRLDQLLKVEIMDLGPAPLLWNLGNNAARPFIYFLTNPAVWDALQSMCCKRKHQLVNTDDEEIEVPLSPVTTV